MSSPPVSKPSLPPSARARALTALLTQHKSGDPLDEVCNRLWDRQAMDGRDRAFTMELVYGVLRRQETLDWRLEPALKKPLVRLPLIVQMLLRLGMYQLVYMDRVPASAAVNESVNLAKANKAQLGRDWSGLVNAVLRTVTRLPERPFPELQPDPAMALSIRYAVPQWLCTRWVEQMGVERAEAACRTVSTVPVLTLRVNRQRVTRDAFLGQLIGAGIAARPTTVSPVGVILEEGRTVTTIPGFQDGLFYVEDEAAQLVPLLLDPQPEERVLDVCAAPGGKATHLAELMSNRGQIVAMDRHAVRLQVLTENCARLGTTIITSVARDARELGAVVSREKIAPQLPSLGAFDRVLVDAPCSGIGVLRRHPDAKGKKDTEMLARHQVLQGEILERAFTVLRPGGVLVYSTCSTEPEETEEVITRICQDHSDYVRESIVPWLPASALCFVTEQGALSTMGNALGMDGFYAVRLRKTQGSL
ncbi:MAG: 16S rRNA (cytosine(967)-C(5))-methyltransferase RsmB [Nitrospira sp.]|nr:16S rRNA (cytosine(967)-C(5))-methyltransferase RsmB [Nitrospira sp.]